MSIRIAGWQKDEERNIYNVIVMPNMTILEKN